MQPLARVSRAPVWSMQADGGKQDSDDLEEKLKAVGSTTKSRLDAAIENPEVAKEMAQSAAQQRIEELKKIAREPPKPRAQVIMLLSGSPLCLLLATNGSSAQGGCGISLSRLSPL